MRVKRYHAASGEIPQQPDRADGPIVQHEASLKRQVAAETAWPRDGDCGAGCDGDGLEAGPARHGADRPRSECQDIRAGAAVEMSVEVRAFDGQRIRTAAQRDGSGDRGAARHEDGGAAGPVQDGAAAARSDGGAALDPDGDGRAIGGKRPDRGMRSAPAADFTR